MLPPGPAESLAIFDDASCVVDGELVRRSDKLAQVRIIDIEGTSIVLEAGDRLQRAILVAMPEQSFGSPDVLLQLLADSLVTMGDAFGILLQYIGMGDWNAGVEGPLCANIRGA